MNGSMHRYMMLMCVAALALAFAASGGDPEEAIIDVPTIGWE